MRLIILFGIVVYMSRTQPIEAINEKVFIVTFMIIALYAIIFDLIEAFKK